MAEIKEVVLKVGDKEINLSLEEAKSLKEVLGDLFGKEVQREYIYGPYTWRFPTITWSNYGSTTGVIYLRSVEETRT